MTHPATPAQGHTTNNPNDPLAIVDSLENAFSILAQHSDFDEAFVKHIAHGLLAVFWGRTPWLENLDYTSPGVPNVVADTYDDDQRTRYVLAIQAPVLAAAWSAAHYLTHKHGRQAMLEAIVTVHRTTPFAEQPSFVPYVLSLWKDATDATRWGWGPNPYGLTCDPLWDAGMTISSASAAPPTR